MPKQLAILRLLLRPFDVLQSRGDRRWLLGSGLGLLLLGFLFAALMVWLWNQTPDRVANETIKLPWSLPSDTAWTTENAYPHLTFFEPTCVAFAQDHSGRAFVLERRGTVQMFYDDANTREYVQVLDISPHVWRTPYEDDGAVAIALHPEFGQSESPNANYFYLLYTAKIDDVRFNRLSRFTLQGETAGDELVLIDQLNENLWHNGGGLAFGPDGFLYIGLGDEGTNGDGLENGQRLDRDLYCGILRIDVDRRGGHVSHTPVRQPETGTTQGYHIPSDNPFVGQGLLEEFWAHGLRNPFRIAFDPANGTLWAADVGHLRREEINIIQRGGNYGWSFREGSLSFDESYLQGNPPAPLHGELVDPVWEYPHLNSNNCVIGGFVYRGGKHANLEGKFIYADNGSGRVWALTTDNGKATRNEELLSLPVSSKTGIASVQPDAQGESLIVILGETGTTSGTIRRVIAADKNDATSLPTELSDTGIFADLKKLKPNPGVIPYEVNAPQSAGAARVRHWICVPGDGNDPDSTTDRIHTSDDDAWNFPVGTIFVQQFDLPPKHADESNWRPIETRVLVRHTGDGVYALSYRWNDEGTDAHLVTEPQIVAFEFPDPKKNSKAAQTQHWQFMDQQSCLACHNANAGFVLGVNQKQWNLSANRTGENQLATLASKGYFHNVTETNLAEERPALVNPRDERASLELRARSYLDVNCGACHREGGARANYFAELHRTQTLSALAGKPLQGDFGIHDAKIVAPGKPFHSVLYYRMAKLGQGRMPFVGAHELDREGLELIRQWIEQMGSGSDSLSQQPTEAIARLISAGDSLSDSEIDTAVDELLSDTSSSFALWQAILDDTIAEPLRSEIIAAGVQHESAHTRDLFEWFVDPRQRTSRLGTSFEPFEVLQHAGDAERGRQLFADENLLTCSKCHSTAEGQALIGPSLWGMGKKYERGQLLSHITNPSQTIDEAFATWMVETGAGRVHHGLIVRRDDNEVVLRDAQGAEHRIASDDVEWVEKQSQSLMPEHLLQSLTPMQAADLLAYLESLQ